MLKSIGPKKMLFITVLLVFVVAAGLYSEFYLKPQLVKSERTLKTVKGKVNTVRNDIETIEEELALYEERQDDFKVLEDAGFFSRQERKIVQQTLDEAQRLSGILGGSFQISPPTCYLNTDLKDSDYIILGSPIYMDVNSYDDIRIYKFLDLFRKKLPGFAVLENFEVVKVKDITNAVLRDIGRGEKTPLISSKITMKWYTIVNKEGTGCTTEF